MKISPQFRLAAAITMLVVSVALLADVFGLLPRPDTQIRETRAMISEVMADQLAGAASIQDEARISTIIRQFVLRRDDVRFVGLYQRDRGLVSGYGAQDAFDQSSYDFSTIDDIVIPIRDGASRWGEARIAFRPVDDLGLRLVGIPTQTLLFVLFLAVATVVASALFLRRALTQLDPKKAIPERVHSAFNVLTEAVMILDESDRVLLANEVFANLIGEAADALIGRAPSSFDWDLSGNDIEQYPWQIARETGQRVTGMPLKLTAQGDVLSFNVNAAPINDGKGSARGVLITLDNVTPIEKRNQELAQTLGKLSETQAVIEEKNRELERLATRDPLTGCLNRRALMSAYGRIFQRARADGTAVSVLMLDIDHFKRINDTYGHSTGDEAIKAVANILLDTAADTFPVGRYGGEEFVVVLPGYDTLQAAELAQKLRTAVSLLAGTAELPLDSMTISVGVATCHAGEDLQDVLIDRADKALYLAKESGRNRVCRYDELVGQPNAPQRQRDDNYVREETSRTAVVQKLQLQLQSVRKVVKEQATEITRRAMYDEFSGLPNRLLLQDRLAHALTRTADKNAPIAVVAFRLSGYRRMAELSGMESAESMIRGAAQRIEVAIAAECAQELDVAETNATCARLAEDELSLLLLGIKSTEKTPNIVEKLTAELRRPFTLDGNIISNEVHCGIAFAPNDGNEADTLMRNASLALNHAVKRSPKSDTVYFSRHLDNMAVKHRNISVELRKAIANDGLEVYYQPKIDAPSQKVVGVEALTRWSHPKMGNIGPTEFITIAENIGVIDKLTNWVWGRVCDDIAGGYLKNIPVSVNVSPIELHDPGTADRLLQIVRSKGIAPTQLEAEITESSILDNPATARQILSRMQSAGLAVVLDDFGTAYSSLNLLLKIPVDVIKIDRSFVSRLHENHDNRAVVQALIQMAHSMGKRIVAEGVETIEERDALRNLGCTEMQGYLYSKPIKRDALQTFVAKYGVAEHRSAARVEPIGLTG